MAQDAEKAQLMEAIITTLAVIGMLIACFIFRRPLRKLDKHWTDVIEKNCEEWRQEITQNSRERAIEVMHDFLVRDNFVPPDVMYDRLFYGRKDNRYSKYAGNRKDFDIACVKEDKEFAADLEKRKTEIRAILQVIDATGEWPKSVEEIYDIILYRKK